MIRSHAVVTLTVQVTTSDCYGENMQMKDLFERAADFAERELRKLINDASHIKLIGQPKVKSVSNEDTK